jgi:hypothetical protein
MASPSNTDLVVWVWITPYNWSLMQQKSTHNSRPMHSSAEAAQTIQRVKQEHPLLTDKSTRLQAPTGVGHKKHAKPRHRQTSWYCHKSRLYKNSSIAIIHSTRYANSKQQTDRAPLTKNDKEKHFIVEQSKWCKSRENFWSSCNMTLGGIKDSTRLKFRGLHTHLNGSISMVLERSHLPHNLSSFSSKCQQLPQILRLQHHPVGKRARCDPIS